MHCPTCLSENAPSAKFCSECGTALAAAERPTLQAQFATMQATLPTALRELEAVPTEDETRPLTILFADLSSSVERTYALDPEETAELLNSVLTVMVEAIFKYDGRINSFLGDGVLAFFGVPKAHEDDAERAIRAALDIRDGLARLGLEGTAGINTGEVYLGRVGSERHRELAARGRAVNLAARLQSQARPGQIVVGETTYRLARGAFDFSPLQLELKGVAEPVPAYGVHRARPRAEKPRGIEGLHAPLEGRDEELDALRRALAEVGAGRGAVAMIVGEAGVGKSRLLAELKAATIGSGAGGASPRWFEGRCVETGGATSYLPYVEVLRDYFGFTGDDDDAERERRIVAVLDELAAAGDLPEERARAIVPILASVLSVGLSADRRSELRELTPEQLKNQTFAALRDFFGALARRRPLVLALEDVHWADTLSLNLTSLLMDMLGETPLLLVCASRPEPEHKWRRLSTLAAQKCGAAYRELHLGELGPDASANLLRALLRVEDVPPEARELVLAKAQGNPFFLEEVLRSLIEAEVLEREDGTWRVRGDVDPALVPDSVQAVILSRVDRLDEQLRSVLQLAAVAGRSFRRSLLAHLVGDEDELERALFELERRELVFKDRVIPEEEYSFKHVLTQETIYRSILRRRRTQLHEQVAEAIEALAAEALEDEYEQLAYHYDRGESPQKAAEYLHLAGEKSRRAYLNDAAIDYFERALARLEALPPDGDADRHRELDASVRESLADVLELTGRHEEATALYGALLDALPQRDVLRRARAARKLGDSYRVQRRADEAWDMLDRAGAELEAEPDRDAAEWWEERVEIALRRMYLAYFTAPLEGLLDEIAVARPIVDAHGTSAQQAELFHLQAITDVRGKRFVADDETLALARASVAAAENAESLVVRGMPHFVLGFCLLWAWRLEEAEHELLRALDHAQRTGDVTLQSRSLAYLTLLYRKRADVEGVRRRVDELVAVSEAGGMVEYVAQAEASLAWLARRDGDEQEAERHAERAWGLWQQLPPGYGVLIGIVLWPILANDVAAGRFDVALEHARSLLDPARQPMPDEVTEALRAALTAAPAEAPDALGRAVAVAERYGYA